MALNCVGNGRILREGPFENIWIQPAAGDAGGALGAALFIWHQLLGQAAHARAAATRSRARCWARRSATTQIRRVARPARGASTTPAPDEEHLCDEVAALLAAGEGRRLVPGPDGVRPAGAGRAAASSATPAATTMQSVMNLKIKFRESFRPFAPSCCASTSTEYFEMRPDEDSPYMLLVAPVREEHPHAGDAPATSRPSASTSCNCRRSTIPAVTHVDYSARVQTVDAQRNRCCYQLLTRFYEQDRLPGADQHQLQRPRRADRLHARGRLPLLHGDRHGRAGVGRQFCTRATSVRRRTPPHELGTWRSSNWD